MMPGIGNDNSLSQSRGMAGDALKLRTYLIDSLGHCYWGCNAFPRPSAVKRTVERRGNDHVEAAYELRTHNCWPGKMRFGFRRPLSLAKVDAVVP
jgi:hypothetical protein